MGPEKLAVLFADLVGSTKLYQTQGDTEAHMLVMHSLQCMKSVIESHSGQLLKTVGDAVLASFESTDMAYLAAVDIQRKHTELNLSVRVGFHYGEVIPDAGDIYGNAVNLAARVASFAESDEICTTEDALAQLSIKHRSCTRYLDQVNFKGIAEPMAVYRIHWADDDDETTIITAASRSLHYKSDLVLHLRLNEKHLTVDARNPVVTFGRASDNNVIVDTDMASRNHGKIEMVQGRFLLHDSSTNGIYLVKGSGSLEFIRREYAFLENYGSIGLGFNPNDESTDIMEFRVSASS